MNCDIVVPRCARRRAIASRTTRTSSRGSPQERGGHEHDLPAGRTQAVLPLAIPSRRPAVALPPLAVVLDGELELRERAGGRASAAGRPDSRGGARSTASRSATASTGGRSSSRSSVIRAGTARWTPHQGSRSSSAAGAQYRAAGDPHRRRHHELDRAAAVASGTPRSVAADRPVITASGGKKRAAPAQYSACVTGAAADA